MCAAKDVLCVMEIRSNEKLAVAMLCIWSVSGREERSQHILYPKTCP
jgi:hypothetical protein